MSFLPPVGQPVPGVGFGTAVKRFFRGYVVFSGRASRSEFWWSMLFSFLITLIPMVLMTIAMLGVLVATMSAIASRDETALLGAMTASTGSMVAIWVIVLVVSLPLVLPTYAVMWRRLQDANFHGAFALLSLAGLSIVPLVMCVMEGRPEGIRFDPAFRAQHAAQYGYGQPVPYGQQPYGR